MVDTVSYDAASVSYIDSGHQGASVAILSCRVWLTVPLEVTSNPVANASQPTISAISWTKALVSRALVLWDRSCDSFAHKHGCWETCTLDGRGEEPILKTDERRLLRA